MQYLGLLNAIPTSWRKKVKNSYDENEINVSENKIIDTQNISSKTLRQILTKKIFEKSTSVKKLEKAIFSGRKISYIRNHIYELSFRLTRDVRMSDFQFMINHNILYTKSRLFKDEITENDQCYLCSGSETLTHLFVECHFSTEIWIDFTSWRNCKNNMQIKLQQCHILFVFQPIKQSFLSIIDCLLVAKNFIYICAKK